MESILLNNSIFCCAEKATNDPETSGLFSAYKKGIIDKILEWIAGLASEREINGIFQIILKLRYKHFQNSLRLNLFQLFGQ